MRMHVITCDRCENWDMWRYELFEQAFAIELGWELGGPLGDLCRICRVQRRAQELEER